MKPFFAILFIIFHFSALCQQPTVEDLWKLYNSGEFKTVISKAKPLLESEPANADLNLMLGRAHTDLGNYSTAIPYLEFTANHEPDNSWKKAWALSYLGTGYFMLQKYDLAEKSVNECIRFNVTKNATNSAFGKSIYYGFDAFYKTWQIVETEHFRFHFQKMNNEDIKNYAEVHEKAFAEINAFFKSDLPKKIDFFVWQSREDAQKLLRANLGFARPEFCLVHTHFQQTPGHEMTHVLSHYAVPITAKTRFINEGTAVCFDLTSQNKQLLVKNWLEKNNKPVSIKHFWENGDTLSEEILYPVAGIFIGELIKKFGKEKFLEFLGNQTYENAKSVFGTELDSLIPEIEKKLNT